MSSLPELLQRALRSLPATRDYRVAYSGGLDSTVLLHLLATLRPQLGGELSAIHIDHGIHPSSHEWGEGCANYCRQLGIPLTVRRVEVVRGKEGGLEAAARHVRYAAFESLLEADQLLLTAHHRDDQAETLLLQLLRGAGTPGLAAMPRLRPLGAGALARPLLDLSRRQLLDYAEAQQLRWHEDPSNSDTAFERNYLRHDLLPELRKRHPAIVTTLARTAHHLGESLELLDQLAANQLPLCSDDGGVTLLQSRLTGLTLAERHNLLRYWLRLSGFPPPATIHLQRIDGELFTPRPDAMPLVAWHGCELRRYRGQIYAMLPLAPPPDAERTIEWLESGPLTLPEGLGRLTSRAASGVGLNADVVAEGRLQVRFRQGGERCRPVGRGHRHLLKKLFQEYGVPPWLRDRWPLLYRNDELLALPGLFVCEPFAAREGQASVDIRWSNGDKPIF